MKRRFLHLSFFAIIVSHVVGCGPAIKKFVNSKYPPVTSLEKSAQSIQHSLTELENIPSVDLGVRLDEIFLDSLLREYFQSMYAADPSLGISSIDKIELIRDPSFALGSQEMIVSAELKFFLKDNKYVRNITIDFSGRLSPSMKEDSLKLEPSFERIRITKIKLRRCLFLGAIAKAAVNAVCRNFMDNLNGQLKTFALKIDYPPFPEIPLSDLLGDDENIKVTNDYTFTMPRQTLHPVIFIKPGSISILAGIAERIERNMPSSVGRPGLGGIPLPPQPDYILRRPGGVMANTKIASLSVDRSEQATAISQVQARAITPEEFDQLFNHFNDAFAESWNANLDQLPANDNSVRISYNALSRITNELLRDAKFGLSYTLDTKKDFPEKEIQLDEIGRPDCGAITFQCNFNNCSNEMHDCGGCKWYDAICQVRRAACHTANGVRWAACQASNAAKAVWCAGELAARKALCYAEVAAIFIYDNLIRDIGKFSGYANAKGTVAGTINRTIPGGISTLGLEGVLNAAADAEVGLNFVPSGIIGHLICTFPVNAKFNLNNIRVSNQPINLRADIERIQLTDACALKINFQKVTIPIQLSEPLLVEILRNPQLLLSCGFSIGLGLTVTSVIALAGNEKFKNYLNAALFGAYKYDFEKQFDVTIPDIPVSVGEREVRLFPGWGEKSIVFTKK